MPPTSEVPDPVDELEATIDEVALAFGDLLSPSELDEARLFVRDALAGHPVGHLLAERIRSSPLIDRSGEQSKESGETDHSAEERKVGGNKP